MIVKLDDFNQIDLKTAGQLPLPVKSILLLFFFAIIFAIGYYLVLLPALENLENETAKEVSLKETFLTKKKQAINLDLYKQQMLDTEKAFGALLKQLPDRSQIDALLTDINQAGLERGLEFLLFKPETQIISAFYAEVPISISVIGRYQDLGAFAENLSKLSRIVTLDDISISHLSKDAKTSNISDDLLVMNATARTYRYLDAGESAEAAKNADDNKGINQ
jgi:type IV pilus assembly protein PilO